MILFIHIREINKQNGLGWHEWYTVASPYTRYSNRQGSYRTPLMPPQPIYSLISRTCINDIMQYLWEL